MSGYAAHQSSENAAFEHVAAGCCEKIILGVVETVALSQGEGHWVVLLDGAAEGIEDNSLLGLQHALLRHPFTLKKRDHAT